MASDPGHDRRSRRTLSEPVRGSDLKRLNPPGARSRYAPRGTETCPEPAGAQGALSESPPTPSPQDRRALGNSAPDEHRVRRLDAFSSTRVSGCCQPTDPSTL